MADDMRVVEVAFKNPPNHPYVMRYRITQSELERLRNDYKQTGGSGAGAYDVQTGDGESRVLMVRFSEILHIG